MNAFLILIAVLAVVSIAAVVWDVRTDGYRAHPVDPALRQRLLDRDEVRRAVDDARAASTAAHSPTVPPQLAEWRAAPHVARTRATAIRPARRVAR